MNDVITKILSDPASRSESVIETIAAHFISALANPWASAQNADSSL